MNMFYFQKSYFRLVWKDLTHQSTVKPASLCLKGLFFYQPHMALGMAISAGQHLGHLPDGLTQHFVQTFILSRQ